MDWTECGCGARIHDDFEYCKNCVDDMIDKAEWFDNIHEYMDGKKEYDGKVLVCERHPLLPFEMGLSFDCKCGGPGMPPIVLSFACVLDAMGSYLAVDGSHGVFDAMKLAEAKEYVVALIGESAIKAKQRRTL